MINLLLFLSLTISPYSTEDTVDFTPNVLKVTEIKFNSNWIGEGLLYSADPDTDHIGIFDYADTIVKTDFDTTSRFIVSWMGDVWTMTHWWCISKQDTLIVKVDGNYTPSSVKFLWFRIK